ncbi:hypothetical protein BO71DRAFT_441242 [Aspergillus ellipticus CBS 707.79]|uniref:Myb-like domain-containing protein n=1 Tax=Aspergillus ellipticus CBS 707.79 TaxID=1448320 RepID=A0A319DJ46_9EURO|nr:hypothetical protein BO71DRAFT_441242 [Aspergillus ellipticus CBS 707.79]
MARLAWSRESAHPPTEGLGKPSKVWTGSPPQRRVTRSQSRELDESRLHRRESGEVDDEQTLLGDSGRPQWGEPSKGRVSGKGLDVIEESPPQSAQTPPHPRYEAQIIPESPEDEVNISGTTALASEPDDNFKHDLMIEALPDLERAAKNVLDLLVPASEDPVSIVNAAKKLGDPTSTQSRRLKRSTDNMDREAEHFGHHTYVNVDRVSRLLLSALTEKNDGLESDWRPSPVLHRANCARFALEILLAKPGPTLPKSGPRSSPKQAIWNAEGQFPLPFMTNLASGDEGNSIGKSFLEKDTFKLALEIRTQYLIMQLEEHQSDVEFDPLAILIQGFFLEVPEDYPEDAEPRVRGFNLDAFRGPDGELPSTYRNDVEERFNDMRLLLEEDDTFDIEVFKGAYRWHRFLLRAVQWIRKRNDEISNDATAQRSAEDVKERFFAKPKSRHSLGSTLGFSSPSSQRFGGRLSTVERLTSTPLNTRRILQPSSRMKDPASAQKTAAPSATPSATHSTTPSATPPATQNNLVGSPRPVVPERSDRMSAPPSAVKSTSRTLPDVTEPERITQSAAPETRGPVSETVTHAPKEQKPASRTSEPARAPERRKSFKPSLLNQTHIKRMAELQRQLRASTGSSDPRRSDLVRSNPPEAREQASSGRGQAVPASAQQSNASSSTQPLETHTTFDASRTLVNDDTEVIDNSGVNDDTWENEETEIFVNDETLDISAHTESHVERSHSPPMSRSVSRPRQEPASTQAPPRTDNDLSLPSSQEVWNMAQNLVRPSMGAPSSSRLAFIDRQENAVRISPVSQGDPGSTKRKRGRPPKRRRPSTESDRSSSDDGFDTDDREVATERRRAEKPAQPPQKRARTNNDEDEDQDRPVSRESAESTEVAQAAPHRDEVEQTPPPPVVISAAARRRTPQAARGRKANGWSSAEDARLIRLIEQYSTSWVKIESENSIQPELPGEARFEKGQVNIKDRARNLKIKFYREGLPIPKNFAYVTMKKTDYMRLEANGIDLSRAE